MSYEPTASADAPSSVVWSYRLYIVGAVLGLIGAVVTFIALPAAISAGTDAANRALQGQSTNGVDVAGATTGLAVGGAVLSAVITLAFSILTIVFARKMRAGRNWARIVLAVFAALQIFGVLGSYGVGAVHFVVVVVALILSFVPTSNAWFQQQKVAQQTATTV
ncbi:hypothetical protein [Amnibacterium kyonggiense]|uniref:DUF2127 domain-containing protein n=1 Tax=Amnibacterium kyonggiense TaxID=595671 RepID=A0A4R7FRG6_9MICO|nr:hypothetical protein [Amnibacterium kyonggiense]TDS80383.1 hypothetical protein CLV52_0943 [Amnibacterium kyonggiense]